MSSTKHSLPAVYDPKLHYNCFIESAVRAELRQECFAELCRRGKISASHYLPDGRLQLIVSDLNVGIDAYNAVIDLSIRTAEKPADFLMTLKRDRAELSSASRKGFTLLAYHEPEALETVTLEAFIRIVNEAAKSMKSDENPLTAFKTTVKRLQQNKAKLPPETVLLYKSRTIGDFWHFLFVHRVDEIYVHGQNDRTVALPYCIDESGQITLISTCNIRKKYFTDERELDERERRNMRVAYTYKPYVETAEELYERFRTRAN